MNLEETRNAIRQLYESKLSEIYEKILKNEIDNNRKRFYGESRTTEGDGSIGYSSIGNIIQGYIECGGIIEDGSPLKFSEQLIEKCGYNFKKDTWWNDYLDLREDGRPKITDYNLLVSRNTKLTLKELRQIIKAYYEPFFQHGKDIDTKLKYMREFVQCGGVINETNVTYIDEIRGTPAYSEQYEQICTISNRNKTSRGYYALQDREKTLSALEAEARGFDIELQSRLEQGHSIGE